MHFCPEGISPPRSERRHEPRRAAARRTRAKRPELLAERERAWIRATPLFAFAPEPREVICAANTVESLGVQRLDVLPTRGALPHDEAVSRGLYPALVEATWSGKMPALNWRDVLQTFEPLFPDEVRRV